MNSKNILATTFAIAMVISLTTSSAYANNNDNPVTTASGGTAIASLVPNQEPGECGQVDLVFAVDDTGSMSSAIDNIKANLPTIVGQADLADEDGTARIGLILFDDSVTVVDPLSTARATVLASIGGISAGGGAGLPEASNEAKNTAVNELAARAGQTGDFAPTAADAWNGTTNILVVITDDLPGGFDDTFDDPADRDSLETYGEDAAAADPNILVSDILVNTTSPNFDADLISMFQADADASGGILTVDNNAGNDTAQAIIDIIADCGEDVVAGELLPIDTTALFVAGLAGSLTWLAPVAVGIAGAGIYIAKTRMNKGI